MTLKIFKGVWFFSLLGLFGVFFYVYASLPEVVLFTENQELWSFSRNTFFYGSILVYTFVNSQVFFINILVPDSVSGFYSWFFGLVITLNAFFIAILSYLFVINGQDAYNFQKLGPAMFGSIGLVVAWLISWPSYYLVKKIQGK